MHPLVNRAMDILQYSYAPYSGFTVAAALQTTSGKVFGGCNVENASYPAGICAERSAIAAAVSAGFQTFDAIAVVGGCSGKVTDFCPPCGVCLQVMSEFFSPSTRIILYNGREEKVLLFSELLPYGFSCDQLTGKRGEQE